MIKNSSFLISLVILSINLVIFINFFVLNGLSLFILICNIFFILSFAPGFTCLKSKAHKYDKFFKLTLTEV